mmetsp:Transcript_28436/g.80246  ORF Transcript_28436/g.80246 Transcript_28436/m.80246 type:complete len:202 (-) Transcript_28436:57-662(-)
MAQAQQHVTGVPVEATQYYVYQAEPQVLWTSEDGRGCGSWTCNILWFFLGGGLIMGLLWGICGCILCVTIFCIPCGINCFKIAGFGFLPFGKRLRRKKGLCACPQSLGNLLWLPVGVFLFLVQIILGITMFISIIGIPFGLQHFKLSILCLWPMGTEVTAKEETSMFVQPPPQVVAMQAPVYAGTAAPPQTNPPPPPPVMV